MKIIKKLVVYLALSVSAQSATITVNQTSNQWPCNVSTPSLYPYALSVSYGAIPNATEICSASLDVFFVAPGPPRFGYLDLLWGGETFGSLTPAGFGIELSSPSGVIYSANGSFALSQNINAFPIVLGIQVYQLRLTATSTLFPPAATRGAQIGARILLREEDNTTPVQLIEVAEYSNPIPEPHLGAIVAASLALFALRRSKESMATQ